MPNCVFPPIERSPEGIWYLKNPALSSRVEVA